MAEMKVRQAGAWVESSLAGKARVGGAWVEFGASGEPPAERQSLFTNQTPASPNFSEVGTNLTLGTVITVTDDGVIAAGRWLFPTSAPAGAVVEFVLYDNTTEAVLRRATFASPVWGAWNEVTFNPYPVEDGQSLVAAVHLSTGGSLAYPFTAQFFTTSLVGGSLTGVRSVDDPKGLGNGRFAAADAYPRTSFNATSYFVDVVFEPVTTSGGTVTLVAPDRPVVAGQSVSMAGVTAANLAAGETITGYSWSVLSGGGSLSASTGAAPTYTAPSGTGVAVVHAQVTTSLGNTGFVDMRVSRAENPVAAENALPGTPRATWDLPVGALGGVDTLQGFCDGLSVDKSETANFKVGQSDGAGWSAQVFRLGWYGGDGARLYATLTPTSGQLGDSQTQPAPVDVDPNTTLPSVDCGNWSTTLTWAPPSWAPSGMYVLRLNRVGGGASHVPFIVRDDARTADLMFMPSDSTWQAYNAFGGLGSSLYAGNSLYYGTSVQQYAGDCARYVSYNRPVVNRGAADPGRTYGAVKWSNFFTGEYPALRFLERNGFDVKYYGCIDAAGDPTGAKLASVSAAMFVGHNEYWSDGMRAGWEAAKADGTHVFSCASNEVYWRLVGADLDADGRPRTWECFKSTIAARGSTARAEWTGTWRDPDGAGKGGDSPENTLTGTIFMVNGPDMRSLKVPATGGYSATPLWRHTAVAALTAGQTWVSPDQILGFEWDTYGPAGTTTTGGAYLAEPHPDAVFCSDATYPVTGMVLTDAGDEYGSGNVTHRLVVHPGGNGALVFGTGTINWAFGLDPANFYQAGNDNVSTVIQQATLNMLADMGATPASLMAGLTMPTPVNWYGPTPPAEEALTMGTPVGPDWTEPDVTLGTRFAVSEAGDWIGMRIWATPTATGITPSIMAYNHDTGVRLAIKQYTEPAERSEYHDVLFDTPLSVSPGVNYQGAVHTTRYGYSPISGLTLPVSSPSGRVFTSSSPSAIATFLQGVTPAATAPTSSGSNLIHISPIVAFD